MLYLSVFGVAMSELAEGELLTEDEHEAIRLSGQLWNLLNRIVKAGGGEAQDGDIRELIQPIHQIQRAVLCNAAARAYPDRYRPLGGNKPSILEKLDCALDLPGRIKCPEWACVQEETGGARCEAAE